MSRTPTDPFLGEIIDELTEKIRRGQAIDLESYRERFGDDCQQIERLLPTLEMMVRLGQSGNDSEADGPLHQPSQIGPYKIREQIGEGGMGTVFVAEQEAPVRRKVALKLIRAGMASKEIIARFEAERQALAMMDHPNIARVFDGGVTPLGHPFFAMELVQGIPMTEFADSHRMTVDQRLQMFMKVCRAVQHAHARGVIHRDLKPSNILVAEIDDQPVPKVIDFGLAKALSQPLTDGTLFTGFTKMIGTPMYMSPEQAAMGVIDVDIRSDVYSLGVLLYELLTGGPPFGRQTFASAGIDEIRRVIREVEPRRPSTAISTLNKTRRTTIAQRRQANQQRLRQSLSGELDWIVMKTLEKDRNRRYETAGALADDVQRYLDQEAVLACPPSTAYQLNKFARRHQVLLTTSAAIMLAMVLGTAVSVWQALDARSARDQSRRDQALAEQAAQREKRERIRADAVALQSRKTAYVSDMKLALRALDEQKPIDTHWILQRQLPQSGQLDVCGPEWSIARHQLNTKLRVVGSHEGGATEVAVFPGGQMMATAGMDGYVRFWRTSFEHAPAADETSVPQPIRVQSDPIHALAVSPDGQTVALAENDPATGLQHVVLFDVSSGKRLRAMHTHRSVIESIRYSDDGQWLASGARGTGVIVTSLIDGSTNPILNGDSGNHNLGFCGDGKIVLQAESPDEPLRLGVWEITASTPTRWLKTSRNLVKNYDVHTAQGLIAYGSGRDRLNLLSTETGENLASQDIDSRIDCVAISGDGSTVAVGDRLGWLSFWSVDASSSDQTDKSVKLIPVGRVKAHRGYVSSVRFTHRQQVASTSHSGSVVLTRVSSDQPTKTAFDRQFKLADFVAQMRSLHGTNLSIVESIDRHTVLRASFSADVAGDLAGNFVVVWVDNDRDGTGIFGQRFDSGGKRRGARFQINTTTEFDQRDPDVSMNAAGEFAVTWQSKLADRDGLEVVAQRYAADGTRRGGEISVSDASHSNDSNASLGIADSGQFVVTWFKLDGKRKRVFARLFNPDGDPATDPFRVNSTVVSQWRPVVAMDPSGSFMVVWECNRNGWLDRELYGQRFTAEAKFEGPAFRIGQAASQSKNCPGVTCSPSGRYLVTWNTDHTIHGQWYAPDGSPEGEELQIERPDNVELVFPRAAASDGDSFSVCWMSRIRNSDATWKLFAADSNDSTVRVCGPRSTGDDKEIVNMARHGVAADASGNMVVVWAGQGRYASVVFGRRYRNDLTPLGTVFRISADPSRLQLVEPGRGAVVRVRAEDMKLVQIVAAREAPVFAGVYESGKVHVWEYADGAVTEKLGFNAQLSKRPSSRGRIALTSDGSRLITAAQEDALRIWDVADGQLLHTLPTDPWTSAFAVSPDDQIVVNAHDTVQGFDIESGERLFVLHGGDQCTCACFDPSGRFLAVGHRDGSIRLWNWQQQKHDWMVSLDAPIVDQQFWEDGQTLFVLTSAGRVHAVRADNGEDLGTLAHLHNLGGHELDRVGTLNVQTGPPRLIVTYGSHYYRYHEGHIVGPTR